MPKQLQRVTVSQISERGDSGERVDVSLHFYNNCRNPVLLLNAPFTGADDQIRMLLDEDFVIWENNLCFVQPNGHPDEPLIFLDGHGAGTLCQNWGTKIVQHLGCKS